MKYSRGYIVTLRVSQVLLAITALGLAATIVDQFAKYGLDFSYGDLALATSCVAIVCSLIGVFASWYGPMSEFLTMSYICFDFVLLGMWGATLGTMAKFYGHHSCSNPKTLSYYFVPKLSCFCGKAIVGVALTEVVLHLLSLWWDGNRLRKLLNEYR